MTSPIIIRCDFFPGSGVGHLKRCNVLARALARFSLDSLFVLDVNCGDLPLQLSGPVALIRKFSDEHSDASNLVELARSHGTRLVIVDSYRISNSWLRIVSDAGLLIVAIDDLGVLVGADLRIDYSAKPKHRDISHFELLGPNFFITDSPRLSPRSGPPQSMILHAGGNGDFSRAALIYEVTSNVAREKGLQITWLCTSSHSYAWLEASGFTRESDNVMGWQRQRDSLWSDYSIVVGPASTSLYEAILQGALPISFPISQTQTSDRDGWLMLGHALHLTNIEIRDAALINDIIYLALSEYSCFSKILFQYSSCLNHLGVEKVASSINDLLCGRPLKVPARNSLLPGIRKCHIFDAEAFLNARNSERVRALSTHKEHFISWPEHILWWCKQPTTERFVLEGTSGSEVFFWHKACRVDDCNYLIGGWFPATANPSFDAAIRLLDWQLSYCAERYPDHLWIATIRRENRSVIMLNRRYGFVDAGPRAQAAAARLFPGTNEGFVVLERKSSF